MNEKQKIQKVRYCADIPLFAAVLRFRNSLCADCMA